MIFFNAISQNKKVISLQNTILLNISLSFQVIIQIHLVLSHIF